MDLRAQDNANVTKESVINGIMKIDRILNYITAEQMVEDAFSILEREDLTQAASTSV